MKIVLLGSGNVATHLGRAFSDAGHSILQVWSRNFSHAQSLANQLQAKAIDQINEIAIEADLYVISVLDDAIISVLKQLKHISAPIVHTSGSTDMNVIAPYSKNYGVFYPLQTFSKEVFVDLTNTPILLEASNKNVLSIIRELGFSISKNVQDCNSTQRIKLHIAAVFSCNFSNHLYAIAQELLKESNLNFDLIRPLILETAQKVMTELPSEVQTGPAVRGDQLTIERHRNELMNHPDMLAIYNLLSSDIFNKTISIS